MMILKPDNTTTTGDVTVNEYLGVDEADEFDGSGKAIFNNTVKSYTKGTEITLNNATLYTSATAESGTKRSGTYFIYDGLVVNGRMRITNDRKNCGNTPIGRYVLGWVSKSSI